MLSLSIARVRVRSLVHDVDAMLRTHFPLVDPEGLCDDLVAEADTRAQDVVGDVEATLSAHVCTRLRMDSAPMRTKDAPLILAALLHMLWDFCKHLSRTELLAFQVNQDAVSNLRSDFGPALRHAASEVKMKHWDSRVKGWAKRVLVPLFRMRASAFIDETHITLWWSSSRTHDYCRIPRVEASDPRASRVLRECVYADATKVDETAEQRVACVIDNWQTRVVDAFDDTARGMMLDSMAVSKDMVQALHVRAHVTRTDDARLALAALVHAVVTREMRGAAKEDTRVDLSVRALPMEPPLYTVNATYRFLLQCEHVAQGLRKEQLQVHWPETAACAFVCLPAILQPDGTQCVKAVVQP
jgi:hypothetical protein